MPDVKDVVKVVQRDGTLIAELEGAKLKKVDWVLNQPGGADFEIGVMDSKAPLLVEPITYEVQFWRYGQLLDWMVPFRPIPDENTLSVGCLGLWSYFAYRYIEATLGPYAGIDQLTIAWNLILHAQTFTAGADLNIDASAFLPSGVNRDRTYPKDEAGNIMQLVDAFTQLINGFDHSIEVFADGRREWTPHYPSKGTLRADLTLEWGRNIKSFQLPKDGARQDNYHIAQGAGLGPAKIQQTWLDQPSIDATALMMDVSSDFDVIETGTLLEKAKAHVGARKRAVMLPVITVDDYPDPTIGVIKVGDRVPVKIDRGAAQVAGTYRVVAITYNPDADTQDLVLNEVAS